MDRRVVVLTVAVLLLTGCYRRGPQYGPTRAGRGDHQMSMAVITGSFIVEPRNYRPFRVVVGADMSRACIEGTFTASGANNDIEVSVLEETQYLNWQNRHQFQAEFESGRVTAGKLKVELPQEPATYFLVFSNRFSIISNKSVVADVTLQYARAN